MTGDGNFREDPLNEEKGKHMKKKFLLIGGSVTILLLSILFGAFFAGPLLAQARGTTTASATSTPTTNAYCQQYLQDLANRLHVSVSTLEQSSLAAKEDVLAQLVKDGKLTRAQADAIKKRLESHTTCSVPGKAKVEVGILRSTLKKYAPTLLSQVASGLHLSASQLQSDLQNGQTLLQVAQAQKVSESQLRTIVLNAVQSTLDQAQKAGDITASQETAFMQFLKNHPGVVKRVLNHTFKHR